MRKSAPISSDNTVGYVLASIGMVVGLLFILIGSSRGKRKIRARAQVQGKRRRSDGKAKR